jgi:fumarate hydratase class II
MESFRVESDSMGEMRVPAGALYGAQTARAVENFPISGLRFPRAFIRALGLIKRHGAGANLRLGLLAKDVGEPIQTAAAEVAEGKWDSQFVVDIFQTGSGTSTNMNANEVIANRAIELLGGTRGDKSVHPNDHVNKGQSSNDVIPSAIHIAAVEGIGRGLIPALAALGDALDDKATEFRNVLKIGRTHLQDATPIFLGKEFSGYSAQARQGIVRLGESVKSLSQLALGGTAVGTGINTHPDFARETIRGISAETGFPFTETDNHFAAQSNIDTCVQASGALKSVAIALIKIANDIRWLGSGPRCGLAELKLPPTQPGSSIMPGKVNPVMCEMLVQVGAQVIGNDATITFASTQGAFELNTMFPVVAYNLLLTIELLTNGCRLFTQRCVKGLEADVQKCADNVEKSLALCTALVPAIGYDKAARIAKVAYDTGRTVRDVALEISGLDKSKVETLLDSAKALD